MFERAVGRVGAVGKAMAVSLVRVLSARLRPAFTLFSTAGLVVDWIDGPGALVLLAVRTVDEMERTSA
jgi:hypothetical protein